MFGDEEEEAAAARRKLVRMGSSSGRPAPDACFAPLELQGRPQG